MSDQERSPVEGKGSFIAVTRAIVGGTRMILEVTGTVLSLGLIGPGRRLEVKETPDGESVRVEVESGIKSLN